MSEKPVIDLDPSEWHCAPREVSKEWLKWENEPYVPPPPPKPHFLTGLGVIYGRSVIGTLMFVLVFSILESAAKRETIGLISLSALTVVALWLYLGDAWRLLIELLSNIGKRTVAAAIGLVILDYLAGHGVAVMSFIAGIFVLAYVI